MSSFCEEYNNLVKEIEELRIKAQDSLAKSESSQNTAELKNISAKLLPAHEKMKALRESITTLPGRIKIKTIELQGLEKIARDLNVGINKISYKLEHNSITSLSISDELNFSDIKPVKLFKNLSRLNLKNVSVEDISSLADLTQIEILRLRNMPIKDISPLSNLKRLRVLSLEGTSIRDIQLISTFSKLTTLVLHKVEIKDLSVLSNLTGLMYLDINRGELKDIQDIPNLSNLFSLKLANTRIGDISPILHLKQLMELDIFGTPAAEDPKQKINIQKLESANVKVHV